MYDRNFSSRDIELYATQLALHYFLAQKFTKARTRLDDLHRTNPQYFVTGNIGIDYSYIYQYKFLCGIITRLCHETAIIFIPLYICELAHLKRCRCYVSEVLKTTLFQCRVMGHNCLQHISSCAFSCNIVLLIHINYV